MLELVTEKREIIGKRTKLLREKGKMPIVIYGATKESTPLTISAPEFMKIWKDAGESTLVNLKTPEGDKSALIHDVAFHPVTGVPLHADFYVIDANKPVRVTVPLEFRGVSPAVKNFGGVLVKVLHEVEIEVLPKNLPHNLAVDISSLAELDNKIFAHDISLPESARLVTNKEEVVALVMLPKEEEEETPPPDLSAIEVEKKGKEETEGETDGVGAPKEE